MRNARISPTFKTAAGSEAGFSLIEVMVALVLLSALGTAVWAGLLGAQGLVRRTIREASGTARMLQLDTYLRQTALRVRTPFWASTPGAEVSSDRLRIPWLDGDPGDAMLIERHEGRLVIGTEKSGQRLSFGPFDTADFGLQTDPSGRPAGVLVSVLAVGAKGDPVLILAPFGGRPLAPLEGR